MNELTERINSLMAEVEAIDGFISLDISHLSASPARVLLLEEKFAVLFPQHFARNRGTKEYQYPTELYTEVNGVMFCALSDKPLKESEAV